MEYCTNRFWRDLIPFGFEKRLLKQITFQLDIDFRSVSNQQKHILNVNLVQTKMNTTLD